MTTRSVINKSLLFYTGETLLEEVVLMSAKVGLVKPRDHIVCVQRMGESFVIKIVSVNEAGDGVEIIRPKSLENLMRVRFLIYNDCYIA